MKIDPKNRKASVSPINKSIKTVDKNRSSKRLIERVEKAIVQQNVHNSVKWISMPFMNAIKDINNK